MPESIDLSAGPNWNLCAFGGVGPKNVVTGVMAMDENRVAGTVRNVGGKVEEGIGRVQMVKETTCLVAVRGS